MKSIKQLLQGVVILSSLFLLSCSKEIGEHSVLILNTNIGLDISTEDMANPLTRSSGVGFDLGDSIGIFVVKRIQETVVELPEASGNFANNVKWVKTKEGWSSASSKDDLSYPKDGSPVDIYAYYPYVRNISDANNILFSIKSDQRKLEGFMTSDLMLASNTEGQTQGNVKLVFRHQFSRVKVEFKSGNGIVMVNEPKAQVAGIYTQSKIEWASMNCIVQEDQKSDVLMNRTNENGYYFEAIIPAQIITPILRCYNGDIPYRHKAELTEFNVGVIKEFVVTLK